MRFWDDTNELEKIVQEANKDIHFLEKNNLMSYVPKQSTDKNKVYIMEGDNYHSLRILQNTHRGKVDIIYIDPPYNTGNDFKYNDKFFDKDDGFKHTKWLNFMEARLTLAINLLSDSGIIVISIDDNEMAHLKLLMDNIFGEENFIAIMPRLTKMGGQPKRGIVNNYDYVMYYSKIKTTNIAPSDKIADDFTQKDEYFDERGYYRTIHTLDAGGLRYSTSLDYPIVVGEETLYAGGVDINEMNKRIKLNLPTNTIWRWSRPRYEFGLANGFIEIKKNRKDQTKIYLKTYQKAKLDKVNGEYKVVLEQRTKPISTTEFNDNKYLNAIATKEISNILGKNAFEYTKPKELIKTILKTHLNKNTTVLDFFAGSGTTAQAVLELNNEDGGNRTTILCTNNENNICTEVTQPRVKKVIEGYTTPKGKEVQGLGGSLNYYNVDKLRIENPSRISFDEEQILYTNTVDMIAFKEHCTTLIQKKDSYVLYKGNINNLLLIVIDIGDVIISKVIKKLNDSNHTLIVYVSSADYDSNLYSEYDFETKPMFIGDFKA